MKWLALIAVLVFAQQPAEAPKGKGASESDSAKSTARAKNTESNQAQPAQPAPAPTETPIATESQRNCTTANEGTRRNGKQTPDEDRTTQRYLTWFTGVLAGVGVLQLVVMFLTWLVYCRQANEMRSQRHEMKRQRGLMRLQWKVMRDQLAQMESSGKQTDKLITHAGNSADAAKLNAQAVINAERPVLAIRFEKFNHPTESGQTWFRIFALNHGRTPARIISCDSPTETACISPDKELKLPYPSPVAQPWTHKAIAPNDSFEIAEFYPRSQINKARMIVEIPEEKPKARPCLVVYGEIRYCEMGADGSSSYHTRFCYMWNTERPSVIGGELILCGPREYNEMA